MKFKNALFLIFASLILASCGADKLSNKKVSGSGGTSLVTAECQMTSAYSPVCGTLNGERKNFDHPDIANCMKALNIQAGHCDCSLNTTPVCGADGQNHTECEARENNIAIVKYVPCSATEI